MYKTKRLVALSMLLLLAGLDFAKADRPQEVIKALATEDLLAVGYVDLNSIDLDTWLKWAVMRELIPGEFAKENRRGLGMAKEILRQIKESGADHIIALAHQQDLNGLTPPLIAISIAEESELDKTFEVLQRIRNNLLLMGGQTADFELAVCKGCIVAGTAEQIARARTTETVQRPNLIKAWGKFSGHDAGFMIFGNQNTRRVIRELFPLLDAPDPSSSVVDSYRSSNVLLADGRTLTGIVVNQTKETISLQLKDEVIKLDRDDIDAIKQTQFQTVTGSLIADKVISVGLSIDFPNELGAELGAKLIAQTQDVDAANIIRDALVQLRNTVVPPDSEHFIGIAAIGLIEPQIKGTDVVLDFGPILNDGSLLTGILKPTLAQGRKSQRINNLRMVILAIHNLASATDAIPAYANFDPNGKPLLSWRVHLLPYLEQQELYDQFKLDEPWNSPHNIKLVELMPPVYGDASRTREELNRAGKTRIVAPFGSETVFSGKEGVTFEMITDGMSNTLAIVAVAPNNAVIWTQPVDWNVDMETPKQGLFDDETKQTIVALADAKVITLSRGISIERLKALLTKDQGDDQNGVEVQMESLEGTWSLVEQQIEGETNPNTFLRYDLSFTDDTVSLVYETADGPSSDGETKYRFTINTNTTPNQLNWFGDQILIQAIYELKGDSLMISHFGKSESARPDSFDHEQSSRSNNSPHILWKFQRKR